jgi:hypothetical protein
MQSYEDIDNLGSSSRQEPRCRLILPGVIFRGNNWCWCGLSDDRSERISCNFARIASSNGGITPLLKIFFP